MLRLPNALRCRFTVASGILKQLQYTLQEFQNSLSTADSKQCEDYQFIF
ncbi:MAG: hypothetical protein LBJ00_13875 [Planctomycetaceae bacterium]|nr:hypothetical protein [Planctomycetaceae bacterium]